MRWSCERRPLCEGRSSRSASVLREEVFPLQSRSASVESATKAQDRERHERVGEQDERANTLDARPPQRHTNVCRLPFEPTLARRLEKQQAVSQGQDAMRPQGQDKACRTDRTVQRTGGPRDTLDTIYQFTKACNTTMAT